MTPGWLLRGGLVIDGTDPAAGGAPRVADVVVRGDRIAEVREPGPAPAESDLRTLDLTGLVLAPGFIDVHSHADSSILGPAADTSKLVQGVTTEVVGNCGISLAPHASPGEVPGRLLSERTTPTWASFSEYLLAVDERRGLTHTMHLVGHSALREAVVGHADRISDVHEVAAMRRELDEALAAGAAGLSSGLIYPPGAYADSRELAALVEVLDVRHVYATHLRNESDRVLDAIEEALHTARGARCGVQISHLKATGIRNHGRTALALERLDVARAAGLRVHQDVYPYTAASTSLSSCLPPWAHAGGTAALLARLADRSTRERLRAEIETPAPHTWENVAAAAGWDNIVVAGTTTGLDEGLSLNAVAEREGVDPFEALTRILVREGGRAAMVEHSMAESDVERVLSHRATIVASDGLPAGLGAHPHPRLHGTFPRVLARYVRDSGVLDLPTAIHKMTGLPATAFGVPERGAIRAGLIADLVAFDPDRILDRATYEEPVLPPEGIAWVMQCGELAVRDGSWTGLRVGRRLGPG